MSAQPMPKRSVSFGPSEDSISIDGPATGSTFLPTGAGSNNSTTLSSSFAAAFGSTTPQHQMSSTTTTTTTNSTTSATTSALKPALKAGTERRKRLTAPEQYQHSDPLLRRLRLVDGKGEPVNLRDFFKGVKVVGFYFSSQWAGQPLKEYHKTISEFSKRHHKEFKVIYVSVDVDEQWYKAGTKDMPWVSMVWNDGSSLPSERSPASGNSTAGPSSGSGSLLSDEHAALYNNEDFLLANEADIDESLSQNDSSGEAYLRPFSRVHLAAKLNIIAAPTLCSYHLSSRKMLDWNVRMGRLAQGRAEETWVRWEKGEPAASFGMMDVIYQKPGTFILSVAAVIYYLLVVFGGEQFNVLGKLVASFTPQGGPAIVQA
ncbi:unnamed protein product [Tilletia controversa]|uniref:Thioredoxin-like fold domain-containing protein n=1 Tax=Tilletia controversa TaxID=13291 RepID=A0A8X7SZJ9_9BASI|nr:hypothetical protein CF328_g1005 [Tilletia controversa]KAE8253974.1 hypothetical protein A4X06_0g1131 [Tilletia controversa]CAD6907609.1 unnamed protein product [Tilletia controversa]CAD6928023.1 unnamed protein product [Tilletia controversa]CAD7069378.1 unnamed protein product [Tilletia caries]